MKKPDLERGELLFVILLAASIALTIFLAVYGIRNII